MVKMTGKIQELRPKAPDSEKITINLGYVDLGHIDLLVQEGFYSNRTDFIRTAIRNQLDRHDDAVKQSVARHQLDLGLRQYSRQDWRLCERPARRFISRSSGWLCIAADVPPELAREHHRLHSRAWRLAGQPRSEGGTERPHPLSRSVSVTEEGTEAPRPNPSGRKGSARCCAEIPPNTRIYSHERTIQDRHDGGDPPHSRRAAPRGDGRSARSCSSSAPSLQCRGRCTADAVWTHATQSRHAAAISGNRRLLDIRAIR